MARQSWLGASAAAAAPLLEGQVPGAAVGQPGQRIAQRLGGEFLADLGRAAATAAEPHDLGKQFTGHRQLARRAVGRQPHVGRAIAAADANHRRIAAAAARDLGPIGDDHVGPGLAGPRPPLPHVKWPALEHFRPMSGRFRSGGQEQDNGGRGCVHAGHYSRRGTFRRTGCRLESPEMQDSTPARAHEEGPTAAVRGSLPAWNPRREQERERGRRRESLPESPGRPAARSLLPRRDANGGLRGFGFASPPASSTTRFSFP